MPGNYAEKKLKPQTGNFVFGERFDVGTNRIQTKSLKISEAFQKKSVFLIKQMREKVSNPRYIVEIFLRTSLRRKIRLYTRRKRKEEEE